jgi:GMP synthase-like glutamine amidotransferase
VRVLVLQHIACEHPGVFSEVLDERGAEAVPVELDAGESLPEWREFDAVLVMGGPMGAYEEADHPWLVSEKELVREAVQDGRPVLGVCLGVQVLASALGAEVRPMEDGAEVGLLPVELTDEGREHPLFAGMPEPLISLQWHGDTFELPQGATLLASSPAAPHQAFQAGQAGYGVQFHMEVTAEMARDWAKVPAYRKSLAQTLGEERGAEFLAEVERRAAELHPSAKRLFGNWLDLASG